MLINVMGCRIFFAFSYDLGFGSFVFASVCMLILLLNSVKKNGIDNRKSLLTLLLPRALICNVN